MGVTACEEAEKFGSTRHRLCSVENRRACVTHLRRRLAWIMHSTLSHLQFPQGKFSTTSHRTLRARQDAHARGARRLATLPVLSFVSAAEPFRFLGWPPAVEEAFLAVFSVFSVSPGVGLSTSPSPGVEAASELVAIVVCWGSCCRVGQQHYEGCIGSLDWWAMQRAKSSAFRGARVMNGFGPLPVSCLLLFNLWTARAGAGE